MRRIGPTPVPGRRYIDRPGAYGIVIRGRQVLLARTRNLLLPGGGIDPGESVLQALHREVYEETGWRIAPVRRVGVVVRHCWAEDVQHWRRKIGHIYLCQAVRRLGPPIEPDHVPVWMDAGEVVDALSLEEERVIVRQVLR